MKGADINFSGASLPFQSLFLEGADSTSVEARDAPDSTSTDFSGCGIRN